MLQYSITTKMLECRKEVLSREEKRKKSWHGKWVRRSLQPCEGPDLCEKILLSLHNSCLKNKKRSNIIQGLNRILSVLKVQNDLTFVETESPTCYRGFLSFREAYEIYCGYQDGHTDVDNFRDNLLHPVHGLCIDLICLPDVSDHFIIRRSKYFDFAKFIEHIEFKKSSDIIQPELDPDTVQTIIQCWAHGGMQHVLKCCFLVAKVRQR